MRKRYLIVLPILIVLVVGWGSLYFGFDWKQWIQVDTILGKFTFWLCMTLFPLAGFPINPFYVFAGLAFKPVTGFLLCASSLFVNMTLGYWLARTLLRDCIHTFLKKRNIKALQFTQKNAFRVTFYARALPVLPYSLQNYLLGASAIPFMLYISVSWPIQALYCTGTIYLVVKSVQLSPWQLVASIGVVVLVVLVGKWIWRKMRAT